MRLQHSQRDNFRAFSNPGNQFVDPCFTTSSSRVIDFVQLMKKETWRTNLMFDARISDLLQLYNKIDFKELQEIGVEKIYTGIESGSDRMLKKLNKTFSVNDAYNILEENNVGFDTGYAKVPIVPGAVLFDLNVGNPLVRPTAEMGYNACKAATTDKIKEGNEGAGTGATVGKLLGNDNMMKGGIGSASFVNKEGLVVGAIVAVNAYGDIRDYRTGEILAGPLGDYEIHDTMERMKADFEKEYEFKMDNTTIAIVGTNAQLTKPQCNALAKSATHGFIRSIYPVCTTLDGDTVFAFSKGTKKCDINILSGIASQVLSEAIENAVKMADEINDIKSYKSLNS